MGIKNTTCPECRASVGFINSGFSLYPFWFKCRSCRARLGYKNILLSFVLVFAMYWASMEVIFYAIEQYVEILGYKAILLVTLLFLVWIIFLASWLFFVRTKKVIRVIGGKKSGVRPD